MLIFLLLLIGILVLYMIVLGILIAEEVFIEIEEDILNLISPYGYNFKISTVTDDFFLEDRLNMVFFHMKRLERDTTPEELEEELRNNISFKAQYVLKNSNIYSFAYNAMVQQRLISVYSLF